jgi:enoyl-CoA hydratase
METVDCEVEGGIARILLNRPKFVNAISPIMAKTIANQLSAWNEDCKIKAIIFEGTGNKGFCSGADLKFMDTCTDNELKEYYRNLMLIIRILSNIQIPVISVIHGYVLGFGGVLLALSDRVIASEDVKIGFPEIHHGKFPYMVLPPLVKMMSYRSALELLLSGRMIGIDTAILLGLVHEKTATNRELITRVKLVINEINQYPEAHISGKRAILQLRSMEYSESLNFVEEKMFETYMKTRKG